MQVQVTDTLDRTQQAQWRDFLARAEHSHPEQDPRFAQSWRATGHDILYAMGRDGGRLCAVAMFAVTRQGAGAAMFPTATAVSGPVCDGPHRMLQFLDTLERHSAFSRVFKLRVTPYWLAPRASELSGALERAGWTPYEEDDLRTTGIHDATGTPDEIASRFNKSARRKLRKARALGLEIEHVSDEATAMAAFAVYNRHFQARYGDTADAGAFIAEFRNVYAEGDLGTLFVVRHEGEIVAGCMVHRSRDTVFFRHSFIDDAAAAALGNVRVAPLITLEALSWGNARGCRYGDENGYIHGLDETHPLYRVYKYKEEFHPTQVQRLPGHQKVLRPAVGKGIEIAQRAGSGARRLARALRGDANPVTARRRSTAAAGAKAAVRSSWFRQRFGAIRIPVGLTLGGTAGWVLILLID